MQQPCRVSPYATASRRTWRRWWSFPLCSPRAPHSKPRSITFEIHYLASPDRELYFALLSDWTDAPTENTAGDAALLSVAGDAIARLNRLHGNGSAGGRFLLLHRRRVWSDGQAQWMGWERKRGKLHELNRLLRGATDTNFQGIDGRA